MNFLWDTNIILEFIRQSNNFKDFDNKYDFFNPDNLINISVVSAGEILSLSIKLNWGKLKLEKVDSFLSKVKTVPIFNQIILDNYAQIDAYSQSKHPTLNLPNGMTARNMGKNDIWIAATAHAIGADLVTTDKDFDHLNGVFLHVLNA